MVIHNTNIFNLPDEILLTIINKLNMIDVYYTLVGVNERFDRIVLDPRYFTHLDLTTKLSDNDCLVGKENLHRICRGILPRIHNKINKLTVDPHSIESIVDVITYPQLYSLLLVNFQTHTLLSYLKDGTKLRCLLVDQITHLNIEIIDKLSRGDEIETHLFPLLLSTGKYLTDLTFSQWFVRHGSYTSLFRMSSTTCFSSTLIKLNINVNDFNDCLYLLDGRFHSLSIMIINIFTISQSVSDIDNTRQLPKLKCFSLISYCRTEFYDTQVVPLLYRMSNVEELTLHLSIRRYQSTYVDGSHLWNEVLYHMTHLNKFIFSINTHVVNNTIKVTLPSNNEIEHSFIRMGYHEMVSCTHHESMTKGSTCHVYSLPYQFENFYNLNCHFRGGLFEKVRWVMMTDGEHPFEHEFFRFISSSFPYLRRLIICNYQPQKRKEQLFSTIRFPYVRSLDLRSANVDYATQFMCDTKIHLPSLSELIIRHESLTMVTHNFTNDATRLICARLQTLTIVGSNVRPENFSTYFPSCCM